MRVAPAAPPQSEIGVETAPTTVEKTTFPVAVPGNEDLRTDRLLETGHERQKTVRRGAGDDFQKTAVLKVGENGDHVAFPGLDVKRPAGSPAVEIKTGQFVQMRFRVRAGNLAFRQGNRTVKVADISLLQKRVAQH